MAVFILYQAVKLLYFDVEYFDFYGEAQRKYAVEPLFKRLSYPSLWLSKSVLYLTPTAILLMYRFYRDQRKLLKINEQKKIAELSALKRQLNPHFLFNTLNNLYALALEKSEKTAEVIERLSDMLDYMLYRTNSKFVLLQKEIELIENYLALEKIRYGNRVAVTFDYEAPNDVKIAPLLLLTFIENAFKHGVRQELKKASIDISLHLMKEDILFKIKNTKPMAAVENKNREEALGLNNVKRQMELLYPNAYELQLHNEESSYAVQLKLQQK
ncbi:MAG: histidine kinase [Maribacter sp.]|uniref:sensor histidine kinase n=1 Tax=Maribacter sp. TaxID=1897614 RepID=UPI003296D1A0